MRIAIKYTLGLIVLLFSMVSCEEIIDVKLPEMEPRLVIDASITENQSCIVTITKTQSFNDSLPPETIQGATIILTDDLGNREELEGGSGRYGGVYISSLSGTVGAKYTLTVIIEGQEYVAEAMLPAPIPVDSIYIYNIQPGKDHWYSPCIVYQDPPGEKNYYHPLVYINNDLLRTIYYDDDEYRDGLMIHNILYFNKEHNNDNELEIGDHITVEFQTINEGAYTYYRTSDSFTVGTNPISNFSGGVLGCFKAYNTTFAEVVITEDIIYTPPKK
jgi:hypothetical protein